MTMEKGLLPLELSKTLGRCTILQKGSTDLVDQGCSEVAKVNCQGSPKCCGGQGDILRGLVGTWCAWTKLYFEQHQQDSKPNSLNTPLHQQPISPDETWIIAAVLGSEITTTCSSWLTKILAAPCNQAICSLISLKLLRRLCMGTLKIELEASLNLIVFILVQAKIREIFARL
ncbi:hypothetical protein PSHT_03079 [Puccinia striiformis]|uniref:Uncharacterized protein n=1 Tax=Puccinia striiformis TaxID=27350 RepID=A0A2S4WGK8_9BASI|nr:hypothetical protein PSHT_03079 [Puccinia striiformis]